MNDGKNLADLTRRQWLLRLGETAVLAGFSGVAGDEVKILAAQTHPASTPAPQALPPGLYAPSPEHMTHALFRDGPFINPPPGSETEYARPHEGPYHPLFFSAGEFPVMRRLVELFLNGHAGASAGNELKPVDAGTIDQIAEWIDLVVSEAPAVRAAMKNLSPRHRTLAVNYFGGEAVRNLEEDDPQTRWRSGLKWLNEEVEKKYGGGFFSITAAQQLEFLNYIADPPKDELLNSPQALFHILKNSVIEGYYTSPAGLKELDFQGNAFHAESPGCPQS